MEFDCIHIRAFFSLDGVPHEKTGGITASNLADGRSIGVPENKLVVSLHDTPVCITLFHTTKTQYKNIYGKLHRVDGPAIAYPDGEQEWLLNGKLHREDGPAIVRSNGNTSWWRHNCRHRLDGPAVEYANGAKEWWADGKLHRLDGPAIINANGSKEWWVNGTKISQFEFWILSNTPNSIVL